MRMSIRHSELKTRFTIAGICLLTGAFAFVGAMQYFAPVQMPALLPFAETHYSRALAAEPDEALSQTEKAIAAAPARAELDALKAYTLIRQSNTLTSDSINALRSSYDKSPFSPAAHEIRLKLIYSYWSYMPLDLRTLANTEARVYARRPSGKAFLYSLRQSVSSDAAIALDLSLMHASITGH